MNEQDRKAAVAAYKERKVAAGIYTIRCIPTSQRWVGRAANLDTIQNRLRFTLQHGIHQNRSLQAAWREHGPDCFIFEVLERLDGAAIAYNRDGALRDRMAHWRAELEATAI
jgi:hypothetical protein